MVCRLATRPDLSSRIARFDLGPLLIPIEMVAFRAASSVVGSHDALWGTCDSSARQLSRVQSVVAVRFVHPPRFAMYCAASNLHLSQIVCAARHMSDTCSREC